MATIGNAPSGEKTVLDGTEKLPISGNFYALVSSIAEYIRTLTQTLTNKTLTTPTIADFTNANHDHGDADDGGAVVSSSATVAGVVELSTDTEARLGTDTVRAITPANLRAVLATMPDGAMFNLKINVVVTSNDLVVSLKTDAGADPSATDPGYVKINGTVRSVTAATSMTLADGTNWYNLGASETATLEQDQFAYAVWDSNSSVVAISSARIPWGRTVNATDFSATTTNERYLGNYGNFTVGDDLVNIGRFAATLSAGAGYTWTVPTFTSVNLIQGRCMETRLLTWLPTHSRATTPYTNLPTQSTATYQIVEKRLYFTERHTQNATPGGTGAQQFTPPLAPLYNFQPTGLAANESTGVLLLIFNVSGQIRLLLYDATAQVTASQVYHANCSLPLAV